MNGLKTRIIRDKENKASEKHITGIEKKSLELAQEIKNTDRKLQEIYYESEYLSSNNSNEREIIEHQKSFKRASRIILKAYLQNLRMSDELTSRYKEENRKHKRKLRTYAPTNAKIDRAEKNLNHFGKGLSIYKILFITIIGSFLGVIIETLWCLLKNGYIESRAGLVYGPFNLLYGIGTAALTLVLYKYRNRSYIISFMGAFITGSIVEYICSLFQEIVFGSRSWDYSDVPFNINGRICLLYSVFWGLLGVFWIKIIYPSISNLMMKIPQKLCKIIIISMTVFLIINAVISVIAVFRWSQRIEGVEAANAFWEFIDSRFNDDRMQRIYANMVYEK